MKKRLQAFYYAMAAFVVCWLTLIPAQLADPDLWGRLSVAALWFNRGEFPYRDVFSFTAFNHRWIDHEWLSGILFYLALLWGGEVGLHLLKYGLILLLYILLFSHCTKLNTNNKALPLALFATVILLLPIYADAFLPTVRSQLFSFIFFAGFIWLLERARQNQAIKNESPTPPLHSLVGLIPLAVIWANAHGGFILGLILLFLYGLAGLITQRQFSAAKPYWLTLGICIAAIATLNPYGLAYWPFILHALTMPRPFISEWTPMPILSLAFWDIKLLMLGGIAAVLDTTRRTRQHRAEKSTPTTILTAGLVLLFLIGLALKGVRFKTFLLLGLFFYMPSLTALRNQPPEQATSTPKFYWPNLLPGLVAAAALTLILLGQPSYYYARTIVQTDDYAQQHGLIPFPVEMMRYLQASPYHGNLINPFIWGEFLAWNLYPRFKVAWDGRYEEVYEKPEMDFFTEFYALPHHYNPERLLQMANRSAGDFVLIEKISPNQETMAQNPAWTRLTTDGFYYLYGRKSSLQKLPPYSTQAKVLANPTTHSLGPTIGDFFQPTDLSRFQAPEAHP